MGMGPEVNDGQHRIRASRQCLTLRQICAAPPSGSPIALLHPIERRSRSGRPTRSACSVFSSSARPVPKSGGEGQRWASLHFTPDRVPPQAAMRKERQLDTGVWLNADEARTGKTGTQAARSCREAGERKARLAAQDPRRRNRLELPGSEIVDCLQPSEGRTIAGHVRQNCSDG